MRHTMRQFHEIGKQHQLKIARATLKMHEAAAAVLGGMDHAEAAQVLMRYGTPRDRVVAATFETR